jgi:hypothetical protein
MFFSGQRERYALPPAGIDFYDSEAVAGKMMTFVSGI